MEKELFKVNEEIFKKEYLPYYSNVTTKVIQFCMVLPYYFPIEENKVIHISHEECYTSYAFEKSQMDCSYMYDIGVDNKNALKKYVSKVIMTYVEKTVPEEKNENYINKCFEILLDSLNNILLSYKIERKDEEIYMLRREMLASMIMYRILDIKKWKDSQLGIFLNNINLPQDKEIINDEEHMELLRHCNVIINQLNPFVNTADYLLISQRLIKEGFYEESVINANIAVESYIRNLYRYFLEIEELEKNREKIENILEDTSFITIVKKELFCRLGGRWDITKVDSEIGKWYNNTYLLRNKIIHGARRIQYEQVELAWQSANECIKYIKSLIINKKKQYPDLYKYFM